MKLKINESKTLEFEMDTSGVSWKELQGFFRLTLENVEYGFPVTIDEGIVRVVIPVFKDVLHESIRSSLYEHKEVTVKARLDLIANNEAYISPWSGELDIEIPVSVNIKEEKVIDKKEKKSHKVTVIDPDVKEYLDEEKKKPKKSKLLDAFTKTYDPVDEKKEEKNEKVDEVKKEKKKEVKDKETRDIKEKKKSRFSIMLEDPKGDE